MEDLLSWVFHFNSEKHSSFVMGCIQLGAVAQAEGEQCVDFSMFPIIKYMGHADLSLLKLDSCVLSDAIITGVKSPLVPAFSSFALYRWVSVILTETTRNN